MAIYAKKNTRGQPTGKWLVEVTTQGKRRRATAESMVEAKRLEASLKLQEAVPELQATNASEPSVYTIGRLRKEARAIWRGNKDERQSLQRFDTCCDILGDATDIKAVRTKQLDLLKESLITERGLQPTTAHRYMASMSAALRWAHERDLIVGMPHIPWPEQGKGREDTISEEDQKRTLAWMQANGYEDVALVYEVLLATGMRIGELLSIQSGDVDTTEQTVTLRDTKNGDDRTVPVPLRLADLLVALIDQGRPSYRRINTAAHRARAALGINHSITPHVMRHTLVTRLEAADVGLKTIGALVGHRSIRTTARYAHPRVETLRQAVGRLKR